MGVVAGRFAVCFFTVSAVVFSVIPRAGRLHHQIAPDRFGRRIGRRQRGRISRRFVFRTDPGAVPIDRIADNARINLIAVSCHHLKLVRLGIVLLFGMRFDKADGIDPRHQFKPVGEKHNQEDRHEHIEDQAEVLSAGDPAHKVHQALEQSLEHIVEAARRNFGRALGPAPRNIHRQQQQNNPDQDPPRQGIGHPNPQKGQVIASGIPFARKLNHGDDRRHPKRDENTSQEHEQGYVSALSVPKTIHLYLPPSV